MFCEHSKYLLSGDIIKNFKFDKFKGTPVSAGGGVYGNKLKYKVAPLWRIDRGDVNLM